MLFLSEGHAISPGSYFTTAINGVNISWFVAISLILATPKTHLGLKVFIFHHIQFYSLASLLVYTSRGGIEQLK